MACSDAFAQGAYPNRPITLVSGWAAGGLSDALGRIIAKQIPFVVVESLKAFPHMFDIAGAHRRIVAFACGTEDFSAATGSQPDPDVLLYPKQQGILAARAAGVLPLGFLEAFANFKDLEGLWAAVAKSRRFGMAGSPCIHPSQVPVLNEGFSPSPEDISNAERVVAAFEAATLDGRGSLGLDGRMLDAPIVHRATRTLAVAKRMAKRQTPLKPSR